jgi:hypothetical protein
MNQKRIRIHHLDGERRGESQEFAQSALIVGRAIDCDVSFPTEKSTSNYHAALRIRDDQLELQDTQSVNGTYLNDKQVDRASLKSGDIIRFGVLGPSVRTEIAEYEMAAPTELVKPALLADPTNTPLPMSPQQQRNGFVRKTMTWYLGMAVGVIGLAGTFKENYDLQRRFFDVLLALLVGGAMHALLASFVRGLPGRQTTSVRELALHVVIASLTASLCIYLWRYGVRNG